MDAKKNDTSAFFDQLYTEYNAIFRTYAKHHGLSETAFWLLYALHGQAPMTQRVLCDEWCYPPQTVNSTLKNLEKQGLVTLEAAPKDRRSKLVRLSASGWLLCEMVIAPLKASENAAYARLTPQEQETLMRVMRKYVALLKETVSSLQGASS